MLRNSLLSPTPPQTSPHSKYGHPPHLQGREHSPLSQATATHGKRTFNSTTGPSTWSPQVSFTTTYMLEGQTRGELAWTVPSEPVRFWVAWQPGTSMSRSQCYRLQNANRPEAQSTLCSTPGPSLGEAERYELNCHVNFPPELVPALSQTHWIRWKGKVNLYRNARQAFCSLKEEEKQKIFNVRIWLNQKKRKLLGDRWPRPMRVGLPTV
jgi:hypothetical protein